MTRKDYQLIAKAIAEIRASYDGSPSRAARLDALDDVTINLSCALRADNPAFDLAKFKQAAGMK